MQPIKLEVKLPAIPNKQEEERFKIVLMDFFAEEIIFDVLVDEKAIYRKNLDLQASTCTTRQTRFTTCAFRWSPRAATSTPAPRRCGWSTRPTRISTP